MRRAWVIPPISVSENHKRLPYPLVQVREWWEGAWGYFLMILLDLGELPLPTGASHSGFLEQKQGSLVGMSPGYAPLEDICFVYSAVRKPGTSTVSRLHTWSATGYLAQDALEQGLRLGRERVGLQSLGPLLGKNMKVLGCPLTLTKPHSCPTDQV